MSRTYRRKSEYGYGWNRKDWYCSEWIPISEYCYRSYRVPLDPKSEEYAKQSAVYHSDAGTHSFKEPGPSWFRNLFSERPQRRRNKNELRKWALDNDYEPMCEEMTKLQYWT